MSFLKFLFFWLMPRPKAGSEWVAATFESRIVYKVVETGFFDLLVTYRFPDIKNEESAPECKSRQSLVAFYRRIK